MGFVFSLQKNKMLSIKHHFNFEFPNEIINAYFESDIGQAWVDNYDNPEACQVIVGDYSFLCGNPNVDSAIDFVNNIPDGYKSSILVTSTDHHRWDELLLTHYGQRANVSTRYSTILDVRSIDRSLLRYFIDSLRSPYKLVRIDEEIYYLTKKEKWSTDLCAQFESPYDYKKRGIGYAILLQNELVAGASSYLEYPGRIEIELCTKAEYRRQGLALACSAMLINECLNKSIYPNWDAANMESLHIAEKLGYRLYLPYKVIILSVR